MYLGIMRYIHSFCFWNLSMPESEISRWKGAHAGIAAGLHRYNA